jgi:uncharacterized protein (DUF2249 family)
MKITKDHFPELELSGIKYDSNGSLESAYVENGNWYLRIKDGEVQCLDHYSNIKSSYPISNRVECRRVE